MTLLATLGVSAFALARLILAQNTATSAADVAAAAATAKTESITSNVPGRAFDRFVVIWLENTDYSAAAADLYSLTSCSNREPNYIAAIGGEYFGMNNDAFNAVPSNVSTVIDLLEDKGISWSEYQEDLPYSGFEGFAWVNQRTGKNDYVRKHNPAIIYNSVADNPDRLAKIKNFTLFYDDLKRDTLPQWMFITPNMTNDGHDTSVTVAGKWARNFLTPLLSDENFMNNTCVLLTFDENEDSADQNRAFAILLGDAIPQELVGTTDSNFYDHYSEISTVEANWDLHTLGRWDVGANVFSFVANKTGDCLRTLKNPPLDQTYLNSSYPGIFNSKKYAPQPVPDCNALRNGRTTLPAIKATWISQQDKNYYHGQLEIPSGMNPPVYP
ncbi:MAG: hypothetical protein M1830_006535 [Pleopsidium flavum]|nr:MAG: hypothetical protein M1830_006535 [Pleopsidium flavum]